MKIAITFFTILTCIGIADDVAAQTDKPIATITGWGRHYGGAVQYSYQLQNLSAGPIKRFTLGIGREGEGESRELTVRPTQDSGSNSFLIPARSAVRPVGWEVLFSYEDENLKFAIDWIENVFGKSQFPLVPANAFLTSADTGSKEIPPGATEGHFSVTVPTMDSAYVSAHAWVDGRDQTQIIRVIKGDTTPPSLDITAQRIDRPGRHNGWVEFVLQASSRDNYDPNPEVTLDAVSASNAGDMIVIRSDGQWHVRLKNAIEKNYRLRFRSVDASGNETVKNFEYFAKKSTVRRIQISAAQKYRLGDLGPAAF